MYIMIYDFISKLNNIQHNFGIQIEPLTDYSNIIKVDNVYYVVCKHTILMSIDIPQSYVQIYDFVPNKIIEEALDNLDLFKNSSFTEYEVPRIGTRNLIVDLEFTGRFITNIKSLPKFICKCTNTGFPLLNDLMEINNLYA